MRWTDYISKTIAGEISRITRYYDSVVQWQPLDHDDGRLLDLIDCPVKDTAAAETLPDLRDQRDRRSIVLLNGNLNHDFDIQRLLTDCRARLGRTSRVVAVAYNPYLAWLYRLAKWLGLRRAPVPESFLTTTELTHLAHLSGFELARMRTCSYSPFRLLGIGELINRVLPAVPLVRWLAFGTIVVLRPIMPEEGLPSLSIVIPARNEAGNIADGLRRIPEFHGAEVEVILVEGHSSDDTWGEIQRIAASNEFPHLNLRAYQQSGRGKKDAVDLGFRAARHDLLTVLDADLTMPPEMLTRFYDAYRAGQADFVNGSRLVYPMETGAMRFLNRLGNIFFAKSLSWILSEKLGDTLCGTKLFPRHDYERIERWLEDFGDIDPFGDFQMLFPAAQLALGIIDVPIRYRARAYGDTNISRFSHGLILLRMTLHGLFKIRLG